MDDCPLNNEEQHLDYSPEQEQFLRITTVADGELGASPTTEPKLVLESQHASCIRGWSRSIVLSKDGAATTNEMSQCCGLYWTKIRQIISSTEA